MGQEVEVTSCLDQGAIMRLMLLVVGNFTKIWLNHNVVNVESYLMRKGYLRGLEPRFSELPPPVEGTINLGESRWTRGEDFSVHPGVLTWIP